MPRSRSRGRAPRSHGSKAFDLTPAPPSSVAMRRFPIRQHGLSCVWSTPRITLDEGKAYPISTLGRGLKQPIGVIEHLIELSLVNALRRLGLHLLRAAVRAAWYVTNLPPPPADCRSRLGLAGGSAPSATNHSGTSTAPVRSQPKIGDEGSVTHTHNPNHAHEHVQQC